MFTVENYNLHNNASIFNTMNDIRNSKYLPVFKVISQFFTLITILYLAIHFVLLFEEQTPIDTNKWDFIKNELPICFILLFPIVFSVYLSIPPNFAQSFVETCNSAGISIPALILLVVFISVLAYYMIVEIEEAKKGSIEKVLFSLGGLITGSFLQKNIDNRSNK